MGLYPKPHSKAWFAALETFNPSQANHTRAILKAAGRDDVCSVCGDFPAEDLELVGANAPPLASIRLCQDCRVIQSAIEGESYQPL